MATGGLENPISGGHDIVPDWPCKPCEETDLITEATAYCRNCDEAYCKPCLRHHNRLGKGHDVLGQADRAVWGKPIIADQRVTDQSTVLDSGIKCSEHEGERINMYCGHHDDVCCSVCAVMNHSDICKPKMSYIPHAATGIASSAELQDFVAKKDQLTNRITQIENEKEEYNAKVDASREACKNTVEEIDDGIRSRIENLKVNTLSEIDAIHDAEILKNAGTTNKCKEMGQTLHALHQLLQPSQPVNEASLFVTLKMNRKKLQSYSQLCDDLNNTPTKIFIFQQDPVIHQLQQATSFGKVKVKDKQHVKVPAKGANYTGDHGKGNGDDGSKRVVVPAFEGPQSPHRFQWSRDASNLKVYKTNEGIQIFVYNASIIKLPVDCIANAANEMLQHGGGLAKVIEDAAGPELTRESDDYIRMNGNLPVGTCCSTTAGRLPFRRVIHTVGPRWYDYHPHTLQKVQDCEECLYSAILNTIYCADKNGMQSVAIPAISSAIFGVPHEICSYQYAKATIDYSTTSNRSKSPLQEVHFVDINVNIVKQIQQMFDAFIIDGSSPTYDIGKFVKRTSYGRTKGTNKYQKS